MVDGGYVGQGVRWHRDSIQRRCSGRKVDSSRLSPTRFAWSNKERYVSTRRQGKNSNKMNQHVQEIRAALTDPRGLCSALGLKGKSRRDGSNVTVYCPSHQEKTPSCSVFIGPDGTIAVNCFGCGFSGDALRLIATVHGFNEKADFKHVLLTAAEIAGLTEIINELSNNLPPGNRPPPIQREPLPDRPYPPNRDRK